MKPRNEEDIKRQLAVALQYKQGRDQAPKVLAKGKGYVAERILTEARKQGVPIREDEPLALALAKVDIGHSIPEELYSAVAEVLAFVFQMNQRHKKRNQA